MPGRSQLRRRLLVMLAAIATLAGLVPVAAALYATTTNGVNTITSAASFPNYPTLVQTDAPWAYHRSEDVISAASTSAAADTSGNSRPGVYAGRTDGPSLRWRFDEGSGSVATDASGSANPGTLMGAAWTASGHVGAGVAFTNSPTTQAVTSSRPGVDTSASYSVSVWMRMTSVTGTQTAVSQTGDLGSAFFLGYRAALPTDKFRFLVTDSDVASPSTPSAMGGGTATPDTWYHLVGVYDAAADTATIYVNAVQGSTVAVPATWHKSTAKVQVGRALYGGATGWTDGVQGAVDAVRFYNRALTSAEVTANYNGTDAIAMAAGQPGALQGSQQGLGGSTAVAFTGVGNAYSNNSVAPAAQPYSIECWFRAAAGQGGSLIGFASNTTGTASTNWDRNLYLDTSGYLRFGMSTGAGTGISTIVSPAAYTDGEWHHVVASSGAADLQLYVDANLVATGSAGTAQTFTGYWRWGGTRLTNWPNAPTNPYLTGTLDEIAIYTNQLTAQQVSWHYHADH